MQKPNRFQLYGITPTLETLIKDCRELQEEVLRQAAIIANLEARLKVLES